MAGRRHLLKRASNFWRAASLAALAALLPAASIEAASPPSKASAARQAKARELNQLRSQIQNLRGQLAADRQRQERLAAELRIAEGNIDTLARALRDLQEQAHSQSRELRRLEAQYSQQQQQLQRHRRALASQLRAMYALNPEDPLKVMLSHQDPAQLRRTLSYYDYLHRARVARINHIHDALRTLDVLKEQVRAQAEHVSHLKTRTLNQRQALEQAQTHRNLILAQLGGRIQDQQSRLQRMEEDKAQLERLVQRLTREARRPRPTPPGVRPPPPRPSPSVPDGTAFAKLKGTLAWPVQGTLAAHFGTSRRQGASKWQGVLINAPAGQVVRVIDAGEVVFADWLRGYGMLLIVDHGEGYMSLYGHNQNLLKKVGETVKRGEGVATVGSSASGDNGEERSGLYFEIRRRGNPVNPALWCQS